MIKSRIFTKTWYKSKLFWATAVFSLYSLLGWAIVPWIAKDQLVQTLKQQAGWDTKIDSVILNPYTLSLTLKQLDIKDGQQRSIVSFDQLYVNYGLLALVNGDVRFQEVNLQKPNITVDVLKDGSTNYQQDFATHSKGDNTQEDTVEAATEETEGEPLQWLLDKLVIAGGIIHINDGSQGKPIVLEINPLSFSLDNFSTRINQKGDYQLNLDLGNQQHLSWQGNISVAPFKSEGVIKLNRISADLIAQYANQFSPFPLRGGAVSLELPYQAEQAADTFQLKLQQASARLEQLALAAGSPEGAFIDINQTDVTGIDFDLAAQKLKIGKVQIDTPTVHVSRSPAQQISVVQSLQSMSDNSTEAQANEQPQVEEKNARPFIWSLDNISLSKGSISWRDESLEQTADVQLNNLQVSLADIQSDLSKAFSYKISFDLNDSSHQFSGNLAPLPLVVDGAVNISGLPLKLLQPYIAENLNLELSSGTTSLGGNFKLAMEKTTSDTEQPVGEFSGKFSLENIQTRDTLNNSKLAGLSSLDIDPIQLKFSDVIDLELGSIKLQAPYGEVRVNKKQQVNLSTLAKSAATETTPTEEPGVGQTQTSSQTNTTASSSKVHLRIGEFKLEKGRFDFADLSQNPPFKTFLNEIQGSIVGLSSDPKARSKVDIQGQLENAGKLAVKGSLNPLSESPNLDLAMAVSNVDLSVMSTYSGRYAGYAIDKGKLNLDLDYKIAQKKLKAGNHVILDQLTMGDSVDSPDAVSLPIPMALALLKDSGGIIDVTLPVEGDLNDPNFSIGGVLLTAITNLITKAATAPFAILGALVPGGDDMASVSFEAGKPDLDINQQSKINKLAEALSSRPNLLLEIRGVAAPAIDNPDIQRQKIEATLAQRKTTTSDLKALQTLAQEQLDANTLATLQTAADKAGQSKDESLQVQYQNQLLSALSAAQKVAQVDLLNLAKTRATNLRDQLLGNKNIKPEQIFIEEADTGLDAKGEQVVLDFKLSPR